MHLCAMSVSDAEILALDPLVKSLARKLRAEMDLNMEMAELEALGRSGLVEAARRFDASRGVQLNTFAYYRIRGAIIDGVRKQGYLSPRAHQARRAAEAADSILESGGESLPADIKADAALALADDILGKLTASYLLAAVGQSESTEETALDIFVEAESKQRVRQALDTLPEREKVVVCGMYFEERPLDEIAAQLGVSKSWASRIHSKGLELLRDALQTA